MKIWKLSGIAVLLTASQVAVGAPSRQNAFARETARRQQLQRSAEVWLEAKALPYFSSSLRRIQGYGISVKENEAVLPPDLGGPLPNKGVIRITVEGWASGVTETHRRSYGSRWHGGSLDTVFVQCRFSQKVMAKVGRDGKPESIVLNQPYRALLACASGSYSPYPRSRGQY
ncbi:MAG TPA: hypothetical protein PL182_04500 [Pseudobdellovibrionaceae bacterium]|nr:hypothetical protein [Pseudobdellovibrionaceae bacterium]